MQELLNDLIKQLTPEVVTLLATIVGILLTKLAGVIRAWSLGKRVSDGASVVKTKVAGLQAQGVIEHDLAAVLVAALDSFARNAAQVDKAAVEGLAKFGRDLRFPNEID